MDSRNGIVKRSEEITHFERRPPLIAINAQFFAFNSDAISSQSVLNSTDPRSACSKAISRVFVNKSNSLQWVLAALPQVYYAYVNMLLVIDNKIRG